MQFLAYFRISLLVVIISCYLALPLLLVYLYRAYNTSSCVYVYDAVRGMPYRRMNYICKLTIYRYVIVNYVAFIYNYNTSYNTNYIRACTHKLSYNHILHNTQRI